MCQRLGKRKRKLLLSSPTGRTLSPTKPFVRPAFHWVLPIKDHRPSPPSVVGGNGRECARRQRQLNCGDLNFMASRWPRRNVYNT